MLHTEIAQIRAMLASSPPLPGPLLRLAIATMRGAAWLLGRWPWLADRVLSGDSERAIVRAAVLEMTVLFDRIERSSKVTIAAINGSCIGGGLELALCFDHRVVLDDPEVRVGCPEVLIGLLPGFGGSQRLTRLLGEGRALDLLLGGELLSARAAVAAEQE
ncbi:MAG: enoyl-CoA hydratase/isomerase family protein, partial [Deltaproteobacteria bacterium]|nr:enoyl-CoA hydratase/isomerase family protein [Kofleriaceae bacterium]